MALDYLSDNFDRQFPKHIDADYEKADLAALYAIPVYKRYPGMMCYVLNDGTHERQLYILKALPGEDLSDNGKWEVFAMDSGDVTNVIQNSQYVQQVSYVETDGDDATGRVNDPNYPFATIKAAVDSLTAAICSVRIGPGDHHCDVEVLQDIDIGVQSLTMESAASNITATGDFVKANQTTLYDFSFYGGGTNITSGNFGFAIEGSNIYALRLVANNIHGDTTGLTLIHPGFNHIVLNGNLSGGTGAGYAVTIRGAMISDVYVRGDITGAGSNTSSSVIQIRDVFGVLNLTWGGLMSSDGLLGTQGVINIQNPNQRSKIYMVGDVHDTRPTGHPVIFATQSFTHFSHKGNIINDNGVICSVQGNSALLAEIELEGKWTAVAGGLFSKSGNRPMVAKLRMLDSTHTLNAIYMGGAGVVHLEGTISNVEQAASLFGYSATIPTDAKVVVGNLSWTAYDENSPIGVDGVFTNALNVEVLGAFRTNSVAETPAHLNINWLRDITVEGGGGQVDSVSGTPDEIEVTGTATDRVVGLAQAAKDSLALADTSLQPGDEFSGDYNDLANKPDFTPYVKKDGSTPFTAPQEGVAAVNENELTTLGQIGDILNPKCGGGDWSAVAAPEQNTWRSIATDGNGVWVAVSHDGANQIMRSDDNGLTWSAIAATEENSWYSIATDGSGVWIAVSANGTNQIMRSDDNGLTWSAIAPPEQNYWTSVATDGNGVWLAVSGSGSNRIMRSDDNGLTWSAIAAAEQNFWTSVATDGSGVWIAVAGSGSNRIMRSDDNGLTWSSIAAFEQNAWNSIATDGSGVWIAVSGYATNQIIRLEEICPPKYVKDNGSTPFTAPQKGVPATQPDELATLSQVTAASGGQVDSVSGTPDEIEVTGTATDRVVGLAQAAKDSLALADTSLQPGDEFSGDYNDLTNKPDLTPYVKKDGSTPFLAPQKGVDGVANDDLATVGQLPSPPDLSPYVKKDGSTPFTAPQPGVDPVNDPDLVTKKYLDDALNPVCTMGEWDAESAAEANQWLLVAYGDGVWIAVANSGTNRVMRSTDDGVTWSPIAAAEANSWYSVAYGDGVWIAVASNGTNRVMRSTDSGVTWSPIAAAEANSWRSVAYGDGVWIAVAASGTNRVMRSTDAGVTWSPIAAAEENQWRSVAYGNGVWIAVASIGTNLVMRSTDAGVTWSPIAATEANSWRSVAYGDGVWIAVADTGTNRVMRSTDAGVTWNSVTATEANQWSSVAYGDDVWIAVASFGINRVMRSTNEGITWSPVAAAEANSWRSVAYGNGVWIAVAYSGTNQVMRSVMSCPPNFVKDDGSVPFLAPQTGVPGTDPNHLATVSQLNSGGGQVDSVTGTTDEIEVDSTDPVNPIVGLAQAAKDSLALADTSLQPGDEFSGDYNDLTNKPDLTPYVKKDGSTPFTAPQVGVEGTDPDHLVTLGQIFNCGDIGEFEIVDTSATSLPINAQILITHRDILIAKSYSGATTTLYKSYDAGDTWQVATTINTQPLYITSGIKSDNTIILVTSSVVYTSTDDFETFTEVTLPMQSSHTMTYGEGMFVIMAHQGTHILSSIDGINWVSHIFTWNPAEYDENGPVIYYAGEDRFIIFNMFSLSSGPVIFFTDSDFTTFTVPTTTPALAWARIPSIFPESGIVAAVSSNDDLVISYDRGDTFVPVDFGYTHGVDYYQVTYEIVWDGTYYRVHLYNMLNNSSVGFLRSLDMVYWEIANPPTPSIADYSYTASDGIFLMNSALNEELIRAIASKCKFVKSINGEQGAITGVVKKNGSIPFTAPQTGVEGTEPNHLATVSQVTAVESLIANSLLSMIWMGTSKDFDSVTNSGFQYSFGAGETTSSTFGLPIPYAAQVTNLYIRADSQPSLEANLELWINGVPSAAKITLGTTEITTNVDVTSSNIMLQPGDFLNIKTLSGEGGGNSVVTIALRNIPA